MLARFVVAASLAVFVASQAPAMFASGKNTGATVAQPISAHASSPSARDARLFADGDGHFSAQFFINGRPVEAIVDTGATFVAISEASARDVGIDPDALVYDHTVMTAAGNIEAARVRFSSLAIGGVSLDDVDALVIRNRALPVALIGMSFLGRLSSYAVAGEVMRLRE